MILASLFLLSACAGKTQESVNSTAEEQGEPEPEVEGKELNIYYNTIALETLKVYFLEENYDIPYVSMTRVLGLLNGAFSGAEYEAGTVDEAPIIKNTATGAVLSINLTENSLTFDDYDLFFASSSDASPINTHFSAGSTKYYEVTDFSYEGAEPLTIDLDDYGFKTFAHGKNMCIPFAAFCAIFPGAFTYVYNGNAIFLCSLSYPNYDENGALTEYGSFFKSNIPLNFSDDLRELTYSALCLSIDLNYALKDDKGIKTADEFFEEKGVKAKIFEGEASVEAFEAELDEIINILLDDRGHTGMGLDESSFFTKEEFTQVSSTEEYAAREATGKILCSARGEKEALELSPDSKTLTVTIDEFTMLSLDSEGNPKQDSTNTPNLIMRANDLLKNDSEYSNVETVVIDLSCNEGGYPEGELFLQSWVRGYAEEKLMSVHSGAVGEQKLRADINGDGIFDENDSITDKKIYVITSGFTYSASAIFAECIKGTENVVLIGGKTGGGCCNCVDFATAIGNSFRMSSNTKALKTSEDEPVSFEDGTEPDISLSNEELIKLYNGNYMDN